MPRARSTKVAVSPSRNRAPHAAQIRIGSSRSCTFLRRTAYVLSTFRSATGPEPQVGQRTKSVASRRDGTLCRDEDVEVLLTRVAAERAFRVDDDAFMGHADDDGEKFVAAAAARLMRNSTVTAIHAKKIPRVQPSGRSQTRVARAIEVVLGPCCGENDSSVTLAMKFGGSSAMRTLVRGAGCVVAAQHGPRFDVKTFCHTQFGHVLERQAQR